MSSNTSIFDADFIQEVAVKISRAVHLEGNNRTLALNVIRTAQSCTESVAFETKLSFFGIKKEKVPRGFTETLFRRIKSEISSKEGFAAKETLEAAPVAPGGLLLRKDKKSQHAFQAPERASRLGLDALAKEKRDSRGGVGEPLRKKAKVLSQWASADGADEEDVLTIEPQLTPKPTDGQKDGGEEEKKKSGAMGAPAFVKKSRDKQTARQKIDTPVSLARPLILATAESL